MQENLFKDFEKSNAKSWNEKLVAELKGKSLDDLQWKIGENIAMNAFYTPENMPEYDFSVLQTQQIPWQIGEIIHVHNIKEANKMALEILMKGIDAPVFHFYTMPSQADFTALFDGIGIEYIFTHFTFDTDNIDYLIFYNLWKSLLTERNLKSAPVFFDFDALFLNDSKQLENMLHIVQDSPSDETKTIAINCKTYFTNEYHFDIELQKSIDTTKSYFDFYQSKGIAPKKIAHLFHFQIVIGNTYLLEIAKIRALKIAWTKLLAQYGLEKTLPFVHVQFAKSAYENNANDHLICATSMAMSAILGGANHLVVHALDESEKEVRLARNTALILKHEAGFDLVSDPMSGSYYVDMATLQLVNAIKL
jgi:methylmalonyl-CoA mutase